MVLGLNNRDYSAIILNVVLISTLIGVLFFTYGSYIEKKVIDNQMKYIIDDVLQDISNIDNDKVLLNIFKDIKKPNLEKEDKEVEEINKALLKKAFLVLGSVFIIGIGISYYFARKGNHDFKDIIKETIIIVIFVGIVEIIFLTFFGSKYLATDSNFIKKKVIQAIRTI
jgi:hypothetical protein